MNPETMLWRIRSTIARLLAAATMIGAGPAIATSYPADNRTVADLGVVSWGTYQAFVTFVEGIPTSGQGGPPNSCVNGALYWDTAATQSKYWYSTFLMAKVSGLHVYVDITQDAYNTCYVAGARIKT